VHYTILLTINKLCYLHVKKSTLKNQNKKQQQAISDSTTKTKNKA